MYFPQFSFSILILFMFLCVLYLWRGLVVAQSLSCRSLTADKSPLCVGFEVDKLALKICCQYFGISLSVSTYQCCFLFHPNIKTLAIDSVFKHHTSIYPLSIFLSSPALCIRSCVFFRFRFASSSLYCLVFLLFICFVSISSY
jgi:hypothetical protein